MKKDKQPTESNDVKVPRWLYESLCADSDLVKHLIHYRGRYWVDMVRKEMEVDRKYGQGMFKESK